MTVFFSKSLNEHVNLLEGHMSSQGRRVHQNGELFKEKSIYKSLLFMKLEQLAFY